MIHEVLLFLANENFDLERLKFNELGDFLHPSEKQLLERIVKIGSDYHWIALFCKNVRTPLNNNKSSITAESTREDSGFYKNCKSQYVKAFANGIDKVLSNYRNDLLKMENFCLENPQISLTYILSVLEKYPTLFDTLKQLIEIVKTDNLNITQLFNRLRNLKNSGIDIISQSIGIIVKAINIVFYEYLCHWIIYGDLIENHNDFFIVDGKCFDENFLYPDQFEESSLSSSTSSTSFITEGKNHKKRPPPVQKFYIDWNLVPIFINKETAESILFMGRIVWILRNNPNSDDCINNDNKKRDIWDGKHLDYYKKIQQLENEIFNRVKFQQIMEECRLKLTQYLWMIMRDEGDLKQHLQLIREYYAVGRGELFNQFIQIVEKHVKELSGYNTNNLNHLFMETARKIYGDNDDSYQKFELILNKSGNESTSTNPWSRISLNFEIKWPLHIIFQPKSIELYNKLFNYLIKLKRTELHLHKLWVIHIKNKQKIHRRVWTLRQHLTFLVNNLQYYLQVDVIEAQFSILLKAVENANEFEDVIKVHHEFISNLMVKTFILTPDEKTLQEDKRNLHQLPTVQFDVPTKVYNVITRLLELCDKFCYVAKSWNNNLSEPDLVELKNFEERTTNIVESLLFILYSLQQKIRGQHLLQLLYQLDFNRYFSKTTPDFNLSATD